MLQVLWEVDPQELVLASAKGNTASTRGVNASVPLEATPASAVLGKGAYGEVLLSSPPTVVTFFLL